MRLLLLLLLFAEDFFLEILARPIFTMTSFGPIRILQVVKENVCKRNSVDSSPFTAVRSLTVSLWRFIEMQHC